MTPPKTVLEQLEKIKALCDSSPVGMLNAKEVADCLGIDAAAFRKQIEAGGIPFACGTSKGMKRGSYYIPVSALWSFMTGGKLETESR